MEFSYVFYYTQGLTAFNVWAVQLRHSARCRELESLPRVSMWYNYTIFRNVIWGNLRAFIRLLFQFVTFKSLSTYNCTAADPVYSYTWRHHFNNKNSLNTVYIYYTIWAINYFWCLTSHNCASVCLIKSVSNCFFDWL
jgi:hypothetical protein